MTTVVLLCSVILIAAILVEWLITPSQKEWIQDHLIAVVRLVEDRRAEEGLKRVQTLFCGVFDMLYGPEAFSRRRVFASVVSSVLSCSLFAAIGFSLGWFEKALSDLGDVWSLLIFSVFLGGIANLIPDYVSLIETRFFLNRAEDKGPATVAAYFVADLVCTYLVFAVPLTCCFATIEVVFGEANLATDIWKLAGPEMHAAILVNPVLRPYLLSTFVTSALWLCFVASYYLILLLCQFSSRANDVLRAFAESERPFFVLSGVINTAILAYYGLLRLIRAFAG